MEKIGFIAECGPHGADIDIFIYAAGRMAPELKVVPAPLGNKRRLLVNCGLSAKKLLEDGCRHVVIFWDLYPSHSTRKPCKQSDEREIMASLAKAGVSADDVSLICIEQELEAWLLADRRALAKFLSTKEHPVSPKFTKKIRNPDTVSNPKGRLQAIFVEIKGKNRIYTDYRHAMGIAREISDCRFLKNSPSFRLFSKTMKSLREKL